MSASTSFDEEAAGYVSAAVQEYCRRSISVDDEVVHAPYCRVIDIGNGIVHPGVRSTRQRLRDIEAECQNIVALLANDLGGPTMTDQPKRPPRRIVDIVSPTYQPSKAKLEADMRVEATFEER